jgi:ATP-dependent Clp protease ATP-binding subunit ClpC
MKKFDDVADSCLKKAESYARVKDKDKEIRVSHLIFAILNDRKYNIVTGVLEELNIDVDLLTDSVEIVRTENIIPQETKPKSINNSKELQEILDFSLENPTAVEGKDEVTIIDIFLSCLQIDNELTEIFKDYHIEYAKFEEIAIDLESDYYNNDIDDELEYAEVYSIRVGKPSSPNNKNQNLEKYCINFTTLASQNKIDACFGREEKLNELYRILTRTKKRNAILIGREGVGKTNLVEGLAVSIVRGNAPKNLLNKTIYSLDINSLVAGTKYRGMFEERIQAILEELAENENAILFIDEIHNIVGAGASESSGDLSNILKPYLARKGFQIIGATTTSEYKKYIEKDKALVRRFSEITIEEPSVEDAIKILNNLKSTYESAHNVEFTNEAIVACVELSHKYMPYRTLPDKAIDILDDVAAKKRLSKYGVSNIIKLQEEYKKIEEQKLDIIKYRSYHLAEEVKKESNKVLSKIKAEREIQNKEKNEQVIIDVADVKSIIQEITKIPITDKGLDVKGLKQHLEKKIIGQENAVNSIVKTVMLNKLELDDNEKPIGSFLFIGYSGVGKTELTKEVSRFLSGNESSLIRIDCSEYSQSHEVSKLIGAPAGYIGYEEGGQLTEKVKRNPFSVILFDEIEKAHEKLFDILLQVLGEGRLTDNKGETISFKNSIIIMTSNVGTKNAIKNMSSIGYSKQNAEYEQSIVEKEVKKQFKPEFINRIDNIIHFNILSREAIMTLLDMELNKLKKQVKKHDVELVISDEVKEFLLDENYSIEYGFRPFKRKINDEIKLIIAEVLLEDKPKEIKITIEDKKIKAVF